MRRVGWPLALAAAALGCSSAPPTCLSVGVNYAGSQSGLVILTGVSTLDSGFQFVASLAAVPPDAGVVGAEVCEGAATGDTVLLTAWLDDGGTAPFCTLPLGVSCSPPSGAPQTSEVVMQPGGKTTRVNLLITDPDGGQ